MGGEKSSSNTTTTVQQTEEEKKLNQLQLSQAQAFDPVQRQLNEQGGNLVLNLLRGQSLPGYLNTLPGGISQDVTNDIVKQSLADIAPQFQASGILDSGVAAQLSARTAADIRTQSEQFNIQNLQQLLNIAVGGQAQVQQPMQGVTSQLGSRLSGLRTVNQSGTATSMNPFLKSFQTSAGSGLGNFFNPSTYIKPV